MSKRKNVRRNLVQALMVALIAAFFVCSSLAEAASANAPFELTYVGRIVNAAGKPQAGPIGVSIDFFDAITEGNLKGSSFTYSNVELSDGIFQVTISMAPSAYHTIFGTSVETFVQVTDTTNNKTYPRQKLFAVPYALKVPIYC